MIDPKDIVDRIEQCKPLIKNWKMMEGIDLDFQYVRIDGLQVDRHADAKYEKWAISLLTTMRTHTGEDGRDVYAVRWQFKDLWGNLAFFSFQGFKLEGSLLLTYIDYDDFAVVGFSIVQPDGTPIFTFNEPDEVSIYSIEFKEHQSLSDIYPDDDE